MKKRWRDVHDVRESGDETVVHFKDGTSRQFSGERAPLTPAQRTCATRFIAEEVRTGRYPRYQAVAVGLARARRECT